MDKIIFIVGNICDVPELGVGKNPMHKNKESSEMVPLSLAEKSDMGRTVCSPKPTVSSNNMPMQCHLN